MVQMQKEREEMMRRSWRKKRKMRRMRMESDRRREIFNSGLDGADFEIAADKRTRTLASTCKSP